MDQWFMVAVNSIPWNLAPNTFPVPTEMQAIGLERLKMVGQNPADVYNICWVATRER
jgi:hypothetical protein